MANKHDSPRGSGEPDPPEPSDLPRLPGVSHAFLTLSTGLRMHVAEAGRSDAPTVLLLHGFPQHWWEWRKVILPLAEHYRVIAPDLRGAGWTDAPAQGYSVKEVLADVLALLDRLGRRRVGLVAHDFSAFVGFRLCFDHPERIAAFLCLGPHPYLRFKPYMLAGIPQLWFQPVVAMPRLGPWALATDRLARHLLRGGFATAESITDEDLAVFTTRLHEPRHPEAGSALYRNLILPEMGRFSSGVYRKRRLTVPTVALVGGADRGVRPGMLDVHGDRADDLAGHVVDGAGHYLADDRPDAVTAHALELFGRVL
ncbi:alpha/beta fold hydrolase [Amycolatopsis japonica]|uniref:alpha/beta fold hydrolase n=1 Tax=Amycolatopsis japonica TaxID=208439 RepID=UPI0036714ADA